MPRVRFRIRTLMIATAAIALLMLAHLWMARTDELTVLVIVSWVTIVVLIPVLLALCVLSFYFRCVYTSGEFLDGEHLAGKRTELGQSGEPKRV
jgi:phosphatidylserine synthase